MKKNINNQSHTSPDRNRQSGPEVKRRSNSEFTPIQKKLAAIALGLILLTGVAIKQDDIHKWVDNNILYDSVDKNIAGPEIEANGFGKADKFDVYNLDNLSVISHDKNGNPDKYLAHNGAEVDVYSVEDGEVVVLEDSADVRTAPIVGNGSDFKTTIFTTEEEVVLKNVKTYCYYSFPNSYGDSFYRFNTSDIQSTFPNGKIDVDGVWVNSKEVSFEKNDKK